MHRVENRQRHCLTCQVTTLPFVSRVNSRVQTLPRPLEGSGLRYWALCNTSSPCFSVHCYHQTHKEKTDNSRQKQGKSILSKVSCWYFPKLERLGRLEFAGIFSPLTQTSSQNAALSVPAFFSFVFRKLFWRELVILAAALHPELADEAILLFF